MRTQRCVGGQLQRGVRKLQERLAGLGGPDDRVCAQPVGELVVRMGVDAETGEVYSIPGSALRQHVFVSGATGSGKSPSVEQLLRELVVSPHARNLRIPVVFVNMKADPEFADSLREMARVTARRFRLVTVTGAGESYNPIAHGSAEQVCSRIVETLDQVAARRRSPEPAVLTDGRFPTPCR
ncbi:ATP-binding protein [Streptomyces sp. G-5]|uniref:ATP-binding protein n=1 Tax=Streptomyces sp. G-5 TaxID=2977231 RepID=UPI0021CE38C6|nr:ATP-binding protein [Streptomyces sp. G-5]MCU4749483.1 ATP-binding protein [Streptomyces sp. G-5]